jgi:hypothetical protein
MAPTIYYADILHRSAKWLITKHPSEQHRPSQYVWDPNRALHDVADYGLGSKPTLAESGSGKSPLNLHF